MSRILRELLGEPRLIRVRPTDSVRQAAQAMYENDVGAVVVMEGESLLGIFTERDALRFFAATRRNPYIVDVERVMTRAPVTVAADMPAEAARALMLEQGFRHLPVMEGGTVLGVVSLRGLDSPATWHG